MDFIGNKKAVNILQRAIEKGAVNHAYIFSGPESVGKFTLAKMFALAAISSDRKLETDISLENKEALLDLKIVRPEIIEKNGISKERDISIESIREVLQNLSLFPYRGKYKVLIIDNAHRMNVSAQNALLKTLEEPNVTSIIILVTHEIDRILPTILSRCQMLNFSLVQEGEMGEFLDLVEYAIGRPGLAYLIKNNAKEKDFQVESHSQFQNILKGSLGEKFSLAEEYSKDVARTLERMNIWTWELRKRAMLLSADEASQMYAKIEKIQEASVLLKRTNANARLILETLFIDL